MRSSDLWNSITLCTDFLVFNVYPLSKTKQKPSICFSLHSTVKVSTLANANHLVFWDWRPRLLIFTPESCLPFPFYWAQWEGGDSDQCLHSWIPGRTIKLSSGSHRWCCGLPDSSDVDPLTSPCNYKNSGNFQQQAWKLAKIEKTLLFSSQIQLATSFCYS